MPDYYDSYANCFAITTSDTVAFTQGPVRGIYVGGAGNIALVPQTGAAAVVFTAVPVGTILRVGAVRVNATSTTATLLVGLQ